MTNSTTHASSVTPAPDAEGVTSAEKPPNFKGSMQNFMHAHQNFFELARTGDHSNIELNADVVQNTATHAYPVTFHTHDAFLVLNHHWKRNFAISFQLRTTALDGLILFSRTATNPVGGDFVAVELHAGHIRFVIDVGNGAEALEARGVAINDNEWHTVTIGRINNHLINVQVDAAHHDMRMSEAGSVSLNVDQHLYVGGVPESLFQALPSRVHSRRGFQGCLASIELQHEEKNVFDETTIQAKFADVITQGCQGACRLLSFT